MWSRHLPMGSSITFTPVATPPCFCKIPPSRSGKIANCQSRVQKVRICWHCSQIKVTMGFPFAHGTQKILIVAALWRLTPFKFGDNPWQVSFTKHARPFQQSTRLHNFLKNRSCQGLSPNPCRDRGHPKNCNHNVIWLVLIFVHYFWAVQPRTNFSKNDGSNSRVSSPDRQAHLRHLEVFFTALAANGLAINLEKCVFATPSLEFLGHKISATGAAPTADHAAEIENCPPPQDIKQLQRFLGMANFYRRFWTNCAQVSKLITDLLRGGGGQNFGVDRFRPGGF